MKVRLTGRWGSRLPGSIISVSTSRALYLQDDLRIGRIIDRPEAEPEVNEPEPQAPARRKWNRK